MVKIFILHNSSIPEDIKIRDYITKRLTERKYEIYSIPFVENSTDYIEAFEDLLVHSDVLLFLISEDSLMSKRAHDEYIQVKSYAKADNKLFYAVTLPSANEGLIAKELHDSDIYSIDLYDEIKVSRFLEDLDFDINKLIGQSIAKKGKVEAIKEKIISSSAQYLAPISLDLQARESYLNKEATKWYSRGFLALLSGVLITVVALIASIILERQFTNNYGLVALFTIKGVLILALMIAASKYCFNLAKSFMNESLKVADRRHAISFGEFYMKVYDQNVGQADLKEIFRDWNISSNNSSFMQQSSEDHDPKVLEQVTKLIQAVKGK